MALPRRGAPQAAPARMAARPAAIPVATRPAARTAARAAPAKSRFQYDETPPEVYTKHANQSTGSYDNPTNPNFQTYKVRDGENSVRIMPRTFDYKALGVDPHWAYPIILHYGVGPDEASYLCRKEMLGEHCSLCEERRLLSGEDPEAGKALRPSRRYLVWVIDRLAEKDGPKIWAMPLTVEKEICLRSVNKKTGAISKIDHPDSGFDIEFKREGNKKENTKYSGIDVSRDASPLSDDQALADKWLEFITENPLDATLQWYDDDYIMQTYGGQREKPDELDAEQPKAGRSRRIRDSEPPTPEETNADIEANADAAEAAASEEVAEDELPSSEEVLAMGEEELVALIDSYSMAIDVGEFSTVEDLAAAVDSELAAIAEERAAAEDGTGGDEEQPPEDEEVAPEEPEPPPARTGRLGTRAARAAAPRAAPARALAKPATTTRAAPAATRTAAKPATSAVEQAKSRLASRLAALQSKK